MSDFKTPRLSELFPNGSSLMFAAAKADIQRAISKLEESHANIIAEMEAEIAVLKATISKIKGCSPHQVIRRRGWAPGNHVRIGDAGSLYVADSKLEHLEYLAVVGSTLDDWEFAPCPACRSYDSCDRDPNTGATAESGEDLPNRTDY